MIGGKDSRKCIKNILCRLFSNALAAKCSWTGAKGNFKLQHLNLIDVCKCKLIINLMSLNVKGNKICSCHKEKFSTIKGRRI